MPGSVRRRAGHDIGVCGRIAPSVPRSTTMEGDASHASGNATTTGRPVAVDLAGSADA
jgi:hypothetical protein